MGFEASWGLEQLELACTQARTCVVIARGADSETRRLSHSEILITRPVPTQASPMFHTVRTSHFADPTAGIYSLCKPPAIPESRSHRPMSTVSHSASFTFCRHGLVMLMVPAEQASCDTRLGRRAVMPWLVPSLLEQHWPRRQAAALQRSLQPLGCIRMSHFHAACRICRA